MAGAQGFAAPNLPPDLSKPGTFAYRDAVLAAQRREVVTCRFRSRGGLQSCPYTRCRPRKAARRWRSTTARRSRWTMMACWPTDVDGCSSQALCRTLHSERLHQHGRRRARGGALSTLGKFARLSATAARFLEKNALFEWLDQKPGLFESAAEARSAGVSSGANSNWACICGW